MGHIIEALVTLIKRKWYKAQVNINWSENGLELQGKN